MKKIKNDGTYFQLTKNGKYYPEHITRWKWRGIDFFIAPEISSDKANPLLKEIKQSDWHWVVTHKGTGYMIPDITSQTATDAKICAEISLEKKGYDAFMAIVESVKKS